MLCVADDIAVGALFIVVFLVAFAGLGGGWNRKGPDDRFGCRLTDQLLVGWAVVLIAIQALQMVTPITTRVSFVVLTIGCALKAMQWVGDRRKLSIETRAARRRTIAVLGVIALATAAWTMLRLFPGPQHYDAGLYYLQTERWLREFAIVPGLGNLHGRLAFNQSTFVFNALMMLPQPDEDARTLAGATFATMLVTWLAARDWAAIDALRRNQFRVLTHLAPLILTPVFLLLTLTTDLASSSPDYFASSLLFVLTIKLAEWLDIQPSERPGSMMTQVFLLAGTALTVKLSMGGFVGTLALIWLISLVRQRPGTAVRSTLPFFVPLVVWALRGYILSGCPAYPSNFGRIEFDWSVPAEMVTEEANWVKSWARKANAHYSEVLGNWDWFLPWVRAHSSLLIRQVLVIVPVLLVAAVAGLVRRRGRAGPSAWPLMVPIVAQVGFWFAMAPNARFACLSLEMLFPASLVVLAASWNRRPGGECSPAWLVLLALTALPAQGFLRHPWWMMTMPHECGWSAVTKLPMKEATTRFGLKVHLPDGSDQAWDAPLPSGQVFNNDLMLRVPGSLQGGFATRRPDSTGSK